MTNNNEITIDSIIEEFRGRLTDYRNERLYALKHNYSTEVAACNAGRNFV